MTEVTVRRLAIRRYEVPKRAIDFVSGDAGWYWEPFELVYGFNLPSFRDCGNVYDE